MMAESRRVELMSSVPLPVEKKKEKCVKTIRLSVALAESNDTTCPEFSYVELLKNVAGISDDAVDLDPNDPFAAQDKAEHDKMLAVAKSFEAKYASKPSKRKLNYRQRCEIRDLVDLGDGYDETDEFIDNTEAYDEFVPSCLTTKFGGFYINVGQLDFRDVSEESADEIHKKKKLKKHRILSDSDDVDSDSKGFKSKEGKDRENGKEERIKKRKRLANGSADEFRLKKRPPGRPPKSENHSVTESPRVGNGVDTAAVVPAATLPDGCKPTVPSSAGDRPTASEDPTAVTGADGLFSPPKLPVRTLPSAAGDAAPCAMESAIESVISQARAAADVSQPAASAPATASDDDIPSLPVSLPQILLEAINGLKAMASKQAVDANSRSFFTPEVNQLLLKIENTSRSLSSSTRSSIYAHIAKSINCDKDILMKRAKKVVLSQHDIKLKQPIALLKEAVSKAMPSLLERHRLDVNAADQLRRERQLEGKDSAVVRRDGGPGSDSDDNGADDLAAGSAGEKQKRILAPRKKFEWTPEIRTLLDNIVRIKMEHYEMAKVRSQSAEEYLKAFFEAELKPIWPQGWIQTRTLFKESRGTHNRLTSSQPRPKKVIMPSAAIAKTSTPGAALESKPTLSATPNLTPVARSSELFRDTCKNSPAEIPPCPSVIDLDNDDDELFEIVRDLAVAKSGIPDRIPGGGANGITTNRAGTPHSAAKKELLRSDIGISEDSIEQRRGASVSESPLTAEFPRTEIPSSSHNQKQGRGGVKLGADQQGGRRSLSGEELLKREVDVGGGATSQHSFLDNFNKFIQQPTCTSKEPDALTSSSASASNPLNKSAPSLSVSEIAFRKFSSASKSAGHVSEFVSKALATALQNRDFHRSVATASESRNGSTSSSQHSVSLLGLKLNAEASRSVSAARQASVNPIARDQQFASDAGSKRSLAVVAPSVVNRPSQSHRNTSALTSPSPLSSTRTSHDFGGKSTPHSEQPLYRQNPLGPDAEPLVQEMMENSLAKRRDSSKGLNVSGPLSQYSNSIGGLARPTPMVGLGPAPQRRPSTDASSSIGFELYPRMYPEASSASSRLVQHSAAEALVAASAAASKESPTKLLAANMSWYQPSSSGASPKVPFRTESIASYYAQAAQRSVGAGSAAAASGLMSNILLGLSDCQYSGHPLGSSAVSAPSGHHTPGASRSSSTRSPSAAGHLQKPNEYTRTPPRQQ